MYELEQGRREGPVVAQKVHGESLTTDQKRGYLRDWAMETSNSDPSRLPTIREAKVWVRESFGTAEGAGLGTDVISKLLRELREELNRKRLGPAGVVGHIEVPATPGELMDQVGRIAQLMKAAGLTSLTVDEAGFPVEMKRFAK